MARFRHLRDRGTRRWIVCLDCGRALSGAVALKQRTLKDLRGKPGREKKRKTNVGHNERETRGGRGPPYNGQYKNQETGEERKVDNEDLVRVTVPPKRPRRQGKSPRKEPDKCPFP